MTAGLTPWEGSAAPDEGDVAVRSGDRLDVEPGTEHSAMLGATGAERLGARR
ncbi:MAG TPA: hypothetical protein VHT97_11885 [Acidimicrobiales bacterium]|jgi:hypothetical protein|nr:hypothetical protein [Acidimicrobiales bacterium]